MNDMTFIRFILWIYCGAMFTNAVITHMAWGKTLSYQGIAAVWLGAALIWYGPIKTRMGRRIP